MQRVGLLGGTFDPIHYAHLAIAEEVAAVLRLDAILVIPAARQPLKTEPHTASAQQRMDMVRLACTGNPRLIPSDLEMRREPPSYTVDTLHDVREQVGQEAELWLILGGDALRDLPRWRAADQIIGQAHLAVVMRPGVAIDLEQLDSQLPGTAARTTMIAGPGLDISSSALRQRFARGQPVRYQLPDRVLDYITEQRLYLSASPSSRTS